MAARRKSIFQNVQDLAGLSAEDVEDGDPVLDLSNKRTAFPNTPEKPAQQHPVFSTGSLLANGGSMMLEQWALLSRMMELASAAQVQAGSLLPGPRFNPVCTALAWPPRSVSSRSPEFPAIASAPNSNGTVLMLADKSEPVAASPAAFALPPHPPAPLPPDAPLTPTPNHSARHAPRFQCPDCSRSYSTFSGLSKHRQFHCTSQLKRQFACKYCEKEYSSLGALKMHIRTHTLPCKCAVCGKAFSRPWLLQGHLRTHTGEKPFRCGHCGRSFADRSNLRAHLQTHSEVKKYRCGGCAKTFSRMSLLHKHEANGCPAKIVLPS